MPTSKTNAKAIPIATRLIKEQISSAQRGAKGAKSSVVGTADCRRTYHAGPEDFPHSVGAISQSAEMVQCAMITLREATSTDLSFIVKIDLKDEGVTLPHMAEAGPEELAEHRNKIAAFISDIDKGAWVYEDTETKRLIGSILWRYRNRLQEAFEGWSIFPQLNESLFSSDGAFCEIFQLWVAPDFRRRGLGSLLKQQAETESLQRGVYSLYTHTEEYNIHVIELNLKLGYREVRRGQIWDEVVRVSLIKQLG